MGVEGATWGRGLGLQKGDGGTDTQEEDRNLDSFLDNVLSPPPQFCLQGEKTELHGKQSQQLVSGRACQLDRSRACSLTVGPGTRALWPPASCGLS